MNFTYNGSRKWNMITKILAKYDPIHSINLGPFKRCVKKCLQKIQSMFDHLEWCEKNFELETAVKLKVEQLAMNCHNFNFIRK